MNKIMKFIEKYMYGQGIFKQLSEIPYDNHGNSFHLTTINPNLPRDTFNVIDVSDSMGSFDYPPSRLDGAILAATEHFNARAKQCQNDRIAVVSFNTIATIVLPLTPITYRETIIMAIKSLNTENGTDIAEGLLAVIGLLDNEPKSNQQLYINLLTDGRGGKPLKIARRLKEEYGVVINVVGIGGSPKDVNESLLRMVATTDQNGCHYRYILDTETLTEHYQQLAQSIVWDGERK